MAYNQINDETFFVESDECTMPRMTAREAAKMLARNRQEMIANELSRLASEEYLEDIMRHMRHMEVCNHRRTGSFMNSQHANSLPGRDSPRCQPH